MKDLPDLALLASARPIDGRRLRAALQQTFTFRGTHALPAALPEPASAWTAPYDAMASQDQLPWQTLVAVTAAARAFLDPLLAGDVDATWNPETWSWHNELDPIRQTVDYAAAAAGNDDSYAAGRRPGTATVPAR